MDPRTDPGHSWLGSMPRPAPLSSLLCHFGAPASCDSRHGTHIQVLPLRASLEGEAGRPHSADGEPGEAERVRGSVWGNRPGQQQEPGLNPALCPQSGDTGYTQDSQGVWVGCVGVTVWMGHGVESEP